MTSDNLKSFKIKLPVVHNADGTFFIDNEKKYSDYDYIFDWNFMSDYMKSIESKAQSRIDLLKSI